MTSCRELLPGQRLVESMLVKRFKLAEVQFEALRQLESEGLIAFERNKELLFQGFASRN
jgi:DNA-binding GntR family transcriptional regulator